MNDYIMKLINISKVYKQGDNCLNILKNVSLNFEPGVSVALVGASGSGKSTLLHIAGLLDQPTSGEVWLSEQNVTQVSNNHKAALRGQMIGFVYQFHHLLPEFTALENIMLPLLVRGVSTKQAEHEATHLIKLLKLESRAQHRPSQLSGGEQQRIAILRALANKPKILLADEPTGNLDEHTADQVFKELIDLIHAERIAALIATHDLSLSQKMDRIIRLKDGQLS